MSPNVYWACRTSWGLFLLARSCFWESLLAWGHRFTLSVEPYIITRQISIGSLIPLSYTKRKRSRDVTIFRACMCSGFGYGRAVLCLQRLTTMVQFLLLPSIVMLLIVVAYFQSLCVQWVWVWQGCAVPRPTTTVGASATTVSQQ